MGNPNWARELVRQCEAMGLEVETSGSGHWKVKFPQGNAIIPKTSSDHRSQLNTLRDLRALGWDQLKEEWNAKRAAARAARLERGRKGAAKDPDELSESETPEMSEPNPGWIEVDGTRIGIAEQGPARYQPSRGGEPRLIPDARELLLIDGSVYFQCLKPTGAFRDGVAEICNRAFPNARSLPTHQSRMHPDPDLGPAEAPAEPEPQAVELQTTLVPVGPMARLTLLTDRLRKLEGALETVATEAGSIAGGLEKTIAELPDHLITDETRQKVAILDQMRGLLK